MSQFQTTQTTPSLPNKEVIALVNRTGAALAEGDLVSLNLDFAATAGQAMAGLDPSLIDTDGATGYVLGAAITLTAENALRFVAVAKGAIADNAYGLFGIIGIHKVKMNTTKGYLLSTSNNDGTISATPTQAIGYQNQTALDAITKPIPHIGVALETTTTIGLARLNAGFISNFMGGGA